MLTFCIYKSAVLLITRWFIYLQTGVTQFFHQRVFRFIIHGTKTFKSALCFCTFLFHIFSRRFSSGKSPTITVASF